ncbi:hypothetical protein BRADI_4g44219v3 [Brachypodium distachyon]|uniref:Uncharacterized protein n=1 Tax=Brachypodium distachyon TaxID=15368 RepID=A0A2K2CU39_BRADI|nr:hypothetical protein BRADI_4g44219v3 [Brachypodium distachyon]
MVSASDNELGGLVSFSAIVSSLDGGRRRQRRRTPAPTSTRRAPASRTRTPASPCCTAVLLPRQQRRGSSRAGRHGVYAAHNLLVRRSAVRPWRVQCHGNVLP